MEFHISRKSRDTYQFDGSIFSLEGNVIFADFHTVRVFTTKMNEHRDLVQFPGKALKAGQISAMGLINEILHYVFQLYIDQNPGVIRNALESASSQLGKENIDTTLSRFVDFFPPLAVYNQIISVTEYIEGKSDGRSNREIIFQELLMLWLANENAAFNPFGELFDETELKKGSFYAQIIQSIKDFLTTQAPFGPDSQTLDEFLRSPAIACPQSLTGQLEYIIEHWGYLLDQHIFRLLRNLDVIREETKVAFGGPGPSQPVDFSGQEFEGENFSPDRDWMPQLVLIAKNAFVWLDQLSKKYNRDISHLDQIPDGELEMLNSRGFSGLWLIGLWQRSSASKKIKQSTGNPEAVSSAYSLYDYQIASALGGEGAYKNLQARAWKYGLRLAADMVPNHLGIYSKWVIEHPDWFISLDNSPFPSYTFSGPNLSDDQRVGIYLEDHYYDRSDAAVVFKRVDFWTGGEKFIYHGNDGTFMPWNDTAQLDFLNAELREAVIQTIIEVARKFPVIRFDAAMTLAKKHFQRLWYPQAGTGGGIPTRSEYGLSRSDFNAAMPVEFWRQVVDRVSAEVPDTLLLAEAFWLMEGYFVRTLGMHRVYNSAFMNMLRDEKNAQYRQLIKNTLEFDPQILKRYVNFMNNPDEETTVAQFGKDDKYFGICTMLVTLPGLPMFGHGQFEGLKEKYGMEYKRAYWDEVPDARLIERHKNEITPLLQRRKLFAEVENFLLYDFVTNQGNINENVFTYSNRYKGESGLVVYNNRWEETAGWIKTSVKYRLKHVEHEPLVGKNLGQGLNLSNNENCFVIFRDLVSGLQYIRRNEHIHSQGLYIQLGAYKQHVFLDFNQVSDDETGLYARLVEHLDGRGVASIEEAKRDLISAPIREAYGRLVNVELFGRMREIWLEGGRVEDWKGGMDAAALTEDWKGGIDAAALTEDWKDGMDGGRLEDWKDVFQAMTQLVTDIEGLYIDLLRKIKNLVEADGNEVSLSQEIGRNILMGYRLPSIYKFPASKIEQIANLFYIFIWIFTHALGKIKRDDDYATISLGWIDEWKLGDIISHIFQKSGLDHHQANQRVELIKALVKYQNWYTVTDMDKRQARQFWQSWIEDDLVRKCIGVNRHQGVLWFNKEAFEQILNWMLITGMISSLSRAPSEISVDESELSPLFEVIMTITQHAKEVGYQVENYMELFS